MLSILKNSVKKLPVIRELISERDQLLSEVQALRGFFPLGHFYSPFPSIEEIRRDETKIFREYPVTIQGIELHEEEQLSLLYKFLKYYPDMPFQPNKREGLRYFFENSAFSYSDAIMYHCMLREIKPGRIIEVGSGYSSCLAMDTNELFFNNSIAMTFIEPYPDLLMSLLKSSDRDRTTVLPSRLQDISLGLFESLKENDILFIDSTHVSKINSDVNEIIFEILPRLASGVYIHFHDIFYPFEYPKEWIYQGIAWNEAYLLRAFLQYNRKFRIVLMNTFMEYFHGEFFLQNMPLCLKNFGGSLWIRKE